MPSTVVLTGSTGASQRVALDALLDATGHDAVRREANAWIKRLRLVRYGADSMRDRFRYRDDSLWWFTELYLHKMRRLERALATVHALDAAWAAHAPVRALVDTDNPAVAAAARAAGAARRRHVDVAHVPPRSPGVDSGRAVGVAAIATRLRPAVRPRQRRTSVAAFVHTAFWQPGTAAGDPGRENYIGPVLHALAARLDPHALRLVGVGPRRNFRARRWWDRFTGSTNGPAVTPIRQLASLAAVKDGIALWRQRAALASDIVSGPDVREAGQVAGCDLWPVLETELRDAACVQWPWSAIAMDEARAALRALEPDVVLTYAEAGGWGRALVLEARRAGVPSAGLQHGFIYRHWLNYQHEPDELQAHGTDAGFPYPTETLVFDRLAVSTLATAGHLPPQAIRVTGSPRLDELAQRFAAATPDRQAVRQALGVGPSEALVVLAAKGTEIDTHLPDLFAAMRDLGDATLVVKPHPAETPDVYLRHAGAADRIVVERPNANLGRLLAASDCLVTMNSTVAIDGLVLGVPALVIGVAGNLAPFVDAGVMHGATGAGIGPALRALLYDRSAREVLLARGARFAADEQMRADGGAARRAADAVCALRGSRSSRSGSPVVDRGMPS